MPHNMRTLNGPMNPLPDAYLRLLDWVTASQGAPIEVAPSIKLSFRSPRQYALEELAVFEAGAGIQLPEDYREFLNRVGSGDYFVNEYGLGFVVRGPEEVRDWTTQVFLGRRNPYPALFLVVSLTGRGDEGGFYLPRAQTKNFAVFSAEDDPERWGKDPVTCTTFSSWITSLVESEGEDDLP